MGHHSSQQQIDCFADELRGLVPVVHVLPMKSQFGGWHTGWFSVENLTHCVVFYIVVHVEEWNS